MSRATIQTTHEQYQELTENDLDIIRTSAETFANVTKHSDDNIQDAGITASSKISPATITEGKIASGAVTASKIADANVTEDKIADDSVTTAKITAANVTDAKLATFNYIRSANIEKSIASTTETLIGSVTITTSGRPVKVSFYPTSSEMDTMCTIRMSTASTTNSNFCDAVFTGYRDATLLGYTRTGLQMPGFGYAVHMPGTMVSFIDEPVAGTYTYSIYGNILSTGANLYVTTRIFAYEL